MNENQIPVPRKDAEAPEKTTWRRRFFPRETQTWRDVWVGITYLFLLSVFFYLLIYRFNGLPGLVMAVTTLVMFSGSLVAQLFKYRRRTRHSNESVDGQENNKPSR